MANVFILRQFSGVLVDRDTDNLKTVSIEGRIWETVDVYPSTILKLAPGKFSTSSDIVAADRVDTHTVILPSSYNVLSRLSFTLSTDQDLLITVVSPDHPNSSVVVYAPDGQDGTYSVVETITSINIQCINGTDANIEYFCFEYPDLTSPDSWQSGNQTTGSVSA